MPMKAHSQYTSRGDPFFWSGGGHPPDRTSRVYETNGSVAMSYILHVKEKNMKAVLERNRPRKEVFLS